MRSAPCWAVVFRTSVVGMGVWAGYGRVVTQKYHSKRDVAKIRKREMETKFPKKSCLFFWFRFRLGPLVIFWMFFFWFWKGKYLGINFTHQIEMMFFIFIRGGVEGHRTHRPPKKHPPKTAQWGVSPCFSFFLEGVYCHWRLCWKIG